ncbi:MAG: adenosylcobinamide-GDP ribazoletransferase [Pirellula sp.]
MSSKESNGITNWIAFLAAVQFLTRIPVSPLLPSEEFDHRLALQNSVRYFPLVGLMIGCFTSVVFSSLSLVWSTVVAACIAIAAESWLTGAFHEDAFADATDALGGGWTKERVLEILKDSRHGTFGVLALVLGIGLRVLLLAEIGPQIGWYAIPISAMTGRWAILWMMVLLPPIEDRHTMVRDVGSQPTWAIFLWSGAVAIAAWFVCGAAFVGGRQLFFIQETCYVSLDQMSYHFGEALWLGIQIAVASVFVSFLFGRYVMCRVGGVTGDFLGANCFLVQLVVLLLYAAYS